MIVKNPAAASSSVSQQFFIPGDCHEGPIWVPCQQRLYFSSTKKLDEPRVGLGFIDFTDSKWDESIEKLRPKEWVHDSNMANQMHLDMGGEHLIVAEQGTKETPSRVTKRSVWNKDDVTVLADNYEGTPLNSVNKVIQTSKGHIIFSDPDYGYMQGFRPKNKLPPSVYVMNADTGKMTQYNFGFEIPHGLTLSSDEKTLFVTDTSASHEGEEDLEHRKTVFKVNFEPESGEISGDPQKCFVVDEGMPDGSFMAQDHLLVGGGDGVYCADGAGCLKGKIKMGTTAVNICAFGEEQQNIFVTIDEGVKVYMNWMDFVEMN